MSPRDSRPTSLCEHAPLYVLGALSPDERSAFEAHLERCEDCVEMVRELGEVSDELTLAPPEVEPSAGLKVRLIERLRSAEPLVVRAGSRSWEPSGVPGVDLMELWSDPARDRQTVLVRMQPGSRYPTHVHRGPEECYVLEGDLQSSDLHVRQGDYLLQPAGSSHGPLWSDQGCLLLITASMHDEIVDPAFSS